MKFFYQLATETHTVQLERTSDGYRAVVDGQHHDVRVGRSTPTEISFVLDGKPVNAYWASDGQRRWVFIDGHTFVLTSQVTISERKRSPMGRGHAVDNVIRAPMPGNVRAVQVTRGDEVTKGQTLVVLEAMKMEIRIQAPQQGKITQIRVRVGEQVERDQVLGEMT